MFNPTWGIHKRKGRSRQAFGDDLCGIGTDYYGWSFVRDADTRVCIEFKHTRARAFFCYQPDEEAPAQWCLHVTWGGGPPDLRSCAEIT